MNTKTKQNETVSWKGSKEIVTMPMVFGSPSNGSKVKIYIYIACNSFLLMVDSLQLIDPFFDFHIFTQSIGKTTKISLKE